MAYKRLASIGIDNVGPIIGGPTISDRQTAFARKEAESAEKAPRPARTEPCTVIYLPTGGRRCSPADADLPQPAARSSTGRVRPYIEALVGWLLIFGGAYLALLLIGE